MYFHQFAQYQLPIPFCVPKVEPDWSSVDLFIVSNIIVSVLFCHIGLLFSTLRYRKKAIEKSAAFLDGLFRFMAYGSMCELLN